MRRVCKWWMMSVKNYGTISVQDVSVSLDGEVVLDSINCVITAKTTAIIGANGSGKTTFARLIAGLVAPDAGTVTVHGIDTVRQEKKLRQMLGFIFSNPLAQLVMPTVAEDLEFGLRGLQTATGKLTKQQRTQLVSALLANSPLAGRDLSPVYTLSGGQQQLLALLGTIIKNPAVVIADEPTALLDLANSRDISARLLGLDAQLLLVTHDLQLAAKCEQALFFADGKLRAAGPAPEIVASYVASVP